MKASPEKQGKSPGRQSESTGESMKDSMSESPQDNDNKFIQTAEDMTDEHGKLDAESFKRSYSKSDDKPKKS